MNAMVSAKQRRDGARERSYRDPNTRERYVVTAVTPGETYRVTVGHKAIDVFATTCDDALTRFKREYYGRGRR